MVLLGVAIVCEAKLFLDEHGVDYEYIDIDENQKAAEKVEELNNGNRSIPTIVFDDGDVLTEPSNEELADKLNILINQ